jgi:hypothetical protein
MSSVLDGISRMRRGKEGEGEGGMSRSGGGERVPDACPHTLPHALGDTYAAVRDAVYYVSAEKYAAVKDACYYSALAQQLRNEATGSIRQHTSAYVSIRQHTSAYVSIHKDACYYSSFVQHLYNEATGAAGTEV